MIQILRFFNNKPSGGGSPPQEGRDMTGKYRIHFTDNYGAATIECKTESEYNETYGNIISDSNCEDVWIEYYDEEEGWQA